MFASYVREPEHCRFEGQDPDEKILLLLRSHPITNFSWLFLSTAVALFPLGLPKLLPFTGVNLAIIPPSFINGFLILDYLLVMVIIFEGFLHWYFNVVLVTNHKVVDIDFESLLYKSVDLAPLENIEEADSTVKGVIKTLFNFGDVSIQTAGAKVAIEMQSVPRPAEVADLILDLSKKAKGI